MGERQCAFPSAASPGPDRPNRKLDRKVAGAGGPGQVPGRDLAATGSVDGRADAVLCLDSFQFAADRHAAAREA